MPKKEDKTTIGIDLQKLSTNYYEAMGASLDIANERINQISVHLFSLASVNIGFLFVIIEFLQIEFNKVILFPILYWFVISFLGSLLSIILGLISLKIEHSVFLKKSRDYYELQLKIIDLMKKTKSTIAKKLSEEYYMNTKPLQSIGLVNKTRWLQIILFIISIVATFFISLSVINQDRQSNRIRKITPEYRHKFQFNNKCSQKHNLPTLEVELYLPAGRQVEALDVLS